MAAMLFDLDGVLYEGDRAIDGARETIDWFRQNRIPYLFVTNTTSKSRQALVEKLTGFGIDTHIDDFLTPPLVATRWLQQNEISDIAVYVPAVTMAEFSAFSLHQGENARIDAVVVGDLGESWRFDTLNTLFRSLMNNPDAYLLALGMTRYWRAEKGLQLDVGPMVKAIEYASGKTAIVMGKPAPGFFDIAKSSLDNDDDLVMIGDDIRGDIQAAQQAGLRAIQVRTGKFSDVDIATGITPDARLDSIADLPGWWREHMTEEPGHT